MTAWGDRRATRDNDFVGAGHDRPSWSSLQTEAHNAVAAATSHSRAGHAPPLQPCCAVPTSSDPSATFPSRGKQGVFSAGVQGFTPGRFKGDRGLLRGRRGEIEIPPDPLTRRRHSCSAEQCHREGQPPKPVVHTTNSPGRIDPAPTAGISLHHIPIGTIGFQHDGGIPRAQEGQPGFLRLPNTFSRIGSFIIEKDHLRRYSIDKITHHG